MAPWSSPHRAVRLSPREEVDQTTGHPPPTDPLAPPPYDAPCHSSTPTPSYSSHPFKRYSAMRGDPRLTARHRTPAITPGRGIPPEILEIIASTLFHSPSTLTSLAMLNKSSYDTVIPYLYHSVPFSRSTLPSLLWAVDLPPPRRFVYRPPPIESDSKFSEKGTPGTLLTPITDAVRARRRRCLGLVREIRVEGYLAETNFCESLAEMNNAIFPNLIRVKIEPDVLVGMAYYQQINYASPPDIGSIHPIFASQGANSAYFAYYGNHGHHGQLAALQRLISPREVEITGGVASRPVPMRSTAERVCRTSKEIVEKLCEAWQGVETITWHGLTTEILPRIPGVHHQFHYVTPPSNSNIMMGASFSGISVETRVNTLRVALKSEIPERPSTWRICGPALLSAVADSTSANKERGAHNAIVDKVLHGIPEDPNRLSEMVICSTEWYDSSEAQQFSRNNCTCYGGNAHGRRPNEQVMLTGNFGVNVADGVRRSVWNPNMSWKVRDAQNGITSRTGGDQQWAASIL